MSMTQGKAETAISANGLHKSFGATKVLRGIDLSVGWGERWAIFGPNGAGKTTLIKILATLTRPSDGEVWVAGAHTQKNPQEVRSRIGVVTHQTYLYDELTALENLTFYGRLYKVPYLKERVEEMLDMVGLWARRADRARTLSRGLQQRLAIARALIHDPPILLLDEPETGLDIQAFGMLEGILKSKGKTVILTTHNLERGLRMSQRVAILVGGRLVYQEEAAAVDSEHLQEVYTLSMGIKR